VNKQELISESIAEMNANKQREARNAVQSCLSRIISAQGVIRKANEEIAKAKADLAAVEIETVALTDVL